MVSSAHGLRPAVFLDRDGVIVVPEFRDRRSFAPKRLEDFRFYPEAAASLQRLKGAGFLLAVITNQPDVGNGLIARSEVDAMHETPAPDAPDYVMHSIMEAADVIIETAQTPQEGP